ncbi:hypothetical protein CORC01_08454 [Colletotrichum orchidophilum]|uniref:Thiaminase-2/PQQC domain-containing protein n=1 Tax=Colletotrichum orchidophilum TaxID=1209926 RepID=A0A1G4B4G0_9PEZI|nr:uncharacterized protein CORC01_08454 [Colletotrichum orchidophilum]OHE96236.1 hypothetical protein CORC01_08454 [Colletotrichum orchidophilum]
MALSLTSAPFNLPNHHLSTRAALAVANINLDAVHVDRGVSPREILSTFDDRSEGTGFADALWNDPTNQDLVKAFMTNDFVWYAAQHPDAEVLPHYQAYGLQDYFYLIDYIGFKALRLNTIPGDDWDSLQREAKGLAGSVDWVNDWRNTLINDLRLTPEEITQAERSVAELAYSNVLQRHTSIDDWFDLHVIMIPCVYGWPKLAKAVYDDPKTLNDTIFYNTWVKPNMDTSSSDKLSGALTTFLP